MTSEQLLIAWTSATASRGWYLANLTDKELAILFKARGFTKDEIPGAIRLAKEFKHGN